MISSLGSTLTRAGRPVSRRILFQSFSSSSSSAQSPLVTTEHLPDDDRIALVKLHNGPANALSLEFCKALSETIQTLEHDGTTQAMILQSGLSNRIFSAGLDISKELHEPDSDRLPEFWKAFQQVFLDLYGTQNLTTIAGLEGPAPAGGCMLVLSCDYRIAPQTNPKAVIGLNESQLGIVAPPWMCRQYIDVLGHRQAELALMEGRLFAPQQALELGLVDELDDDVQQAAIAKAKEFNQIPQSARAAVKQLTRKPLLDSLVKDRQRDIDFFCNFVTSPQAQTAIGRYLQAMAAGKSKSK